MEYIKEIENGKLKIVNVEVPLVQGGVLRKTFSREKVKMENLKSIARAWADKLGSEEWGDQLWYALKRGHFTVEELRDPSVRFKEAWIRGGKVRELRWVEPDGTRRSKMLSVGTKRNRQQCLEQMNLIRARVVADFYGLDLDDSALNFNFLTN